MSDGAKVVSLIGAPIPGREANAKIVVQLKHYLAMAERGEIVGMAWAYVIPGDECRFQFETGASGNNILAAVDMLRHHMLNQFMSDMRHITFEDEGA